MPDSDFPKPNTFIAGAPKCGTTSLAHWLSEHPDIFVPAKKEPHFFHQELNNCGTEADYFSLYENCAESARIKIDASTSYFTNINSIRFIENKIRSPNYIIMLRNPIELVQSWHSECVFLGREDVDDLEVAWHLQEFRASGQHIPFSCYAPSSLKYKEQALIGNSLYELLRIAGRERVHWIFLDDIKAKPKVVYSDVLKFLKVASDNRTDFPILNKAKRHRFPALNRATRVMGMVRHRLGLPGLGIRSALTRLGRIEQSNSPLSKSFEYRLYGEFKDDIALLEGLTGRNLGHWNPDSATGNATPESAVR